MASMTPTTALVTCEQALRLLLSNVLRQAYGNNWLAKVASVEQMTEWQSRRATETAKRERRGVAEVPRSELAYAGFRELKDIAIANWSYVAPALGKQKETEALLKRFDDLRNTIAHSRDLLPFEADLLAGIAGEVRNRVTIFMSSQDPSGDYYPRIESVTDGLGHTAAEQLIPVVPEFTLVTTATLRPGDVVTYNCKGTDPQGRPLSWWLQETNGEIFCRAVGNEVQLVWAVKEKDVADRTYACIRMKAENAKYHRSQAADMSVTFYYRVLPPPLQIGEPI